jgi:hypothetical protein
MINLTVTGGAGPYTYNWSNTATTQNLTGLQPGTYTVTVTDANMCTGTASFTVGQPTAGTINVTGTAANTGCTTSNGSVNITATGGTAPYTYSWNNTATTQNLTGVQPGTYTVTVTDAFGCTGTGSFTVGSPSGSNLTVTGTATNFSCNTTSNGMINITTAGGSGPYTYSWSNNATTQNLTGLQPGTYTVTVTDAFGCTGTSSFTVGQPVTFNLANMVSVSPSVAVPGHPMNTIYLGYGPQTVTLNSSATGGSGFTFNWTTTTSTTSLGTNGSLAVSPTTTTSYIVTTMNSLGCIDIDTVTINVIDVRCGNNNNKVKICHKGGKFNKSSLCVDASAVASHLAHGDKLGDCFTGSSNNSTFPAKMMQTESGALTVYPNPTSGTINLALPEFEENAQVTVTDISGKVIKTIAVGADHGSELKVDLSGNAKGVYLVELITKQETYRSKVVLQ